MPAYSTTVKNRRFSFRDLKDVMARATPRRSGDELAGLAATSELERAAAQTVLADIPLQRFREELLVPYETDEVTRLIIDNVNEAAFAPLRNLTVGQLREWMLLYETGADELTAVAPGLTPEMVAAVSKVSRNIDLMVIARKCRVITRHRCTLGLEGRMATRLQPNHPADDPAAIAATVLDGLLYGTGDACIGINPATDSVPAIITLLTLLRELIDRYEIPTQSCVLAHITTTLRALELNAPVDLIFQSIAGTEAANTAFGVNLKLLDEAQSVMSSIANRQSQIANVFYFETGQGSALSSNTHHNIDQQTLEARAYAVARRYSPLLVNTVVGFIGPEYLYDAKQITRAGLEDHFCGKVLGLPMGVDVCYTNHAQADQNDMDNLLTLLGAAGVNYVMAIPGADDVMLGYQSTSHHDSASLRALLNLRPAPEFETWLEKMSITQANRLLPAGSQHKLLT